MKNIFLICLTLTAVVSQPKFLCLSPMPQLSNLALHYSGTPVNCCALWTMGQQ
ncbi:hypothetical protein JZ751_003616 [Albula glossodonta]|uniref:Uncharacterized protein n=1 Tax=Albula glossodonta TaxID=121402 RepID=A0A8T2MMD5_9TELE|nr:hypothetical protein JZ751_003616 [Albula glossodonta]